jgi:hypothetical protein
MVLMASPLSTVTVTVNGLLLEQRGAMGVTI